jgi:hypothetical protein
MAQKHRNQSSELSQVVTNFESRLNLSSSEEIRNILSQHDCAVFQLAKLEHNVLQGLEEIQIEKEPIVLLKALILFLGFGVSNIYETRLGRIMSRHFEGDNVNSIMIFNLSNTLDFTEVLRKIGIIFKEESFIVMERGGGNNYRLGTGITIKFRNGEKVPLSEPFDTNNESNDSTNERRIIVENFRQLQINSKKVVTDYARPIIELMNTIQ